MPPTSGDRLGFAGPASRQARPPLRVVLFSGGRGAGVLTSELLTHPQIDLTLAINGYDDGASTGEVRRFLGDSLGPSDFRKNAARVARELRCGALDLVTLLDVRLPIGCTRERALTILGCIRHADSPKGDSAASEAGELASRLDQTIRQAVSDRLQRFEAALRPGEPFEFSDCSLGNLVFAGGYLLADRDFNAGVADYCALLGVPSGLIENVTDGTNAFLVALDREGRLLGSEGDIVDATRKNRIQNIYLIERPLTAEELTRLAAQSPELIESFLEARQASIRMNPRLPDRIAAADLIVYAPGTQHSSLFPSYLTPGLSTAIARNLRAIKLLVTNIQVDAEIPDSSAVDIIERATFYLREKDRQRTPAPCLITHYLINRPGPASRQTHYVPLGPLDSLEDLRLVHVGNYEEGLTGRHDAHRVLAPFVDAFLDRTATLRLAIWLEEASAPGKVVQTLLEMIRGGIDDLRVRVTVFYSGAELETGFLASLPFEVRSVYGSGGADGPHIGREIATGSFDYVVLFESSGMYDGEDIVAIASHLIQGRLDAVWGSRRLSVRDIHLSYRLRYRKKLLLGIISYTGSHVLSLAYLFLYGRYISDTLSGARAIRSTYLPALHAGGAHVQLNQRLLSSLLSDKAEMLEVPVRFLPLSPEKVRRPGVLDGLRALASIVWWRLSGNAAERPTDSQRSQPLPPNRHEGPDTQRTPTSPETLR